MKQQINFKKFYEEYGNQWSTKGRKRCEQLSSNWKAKKILFILNKNKEIKIKSILDFGCGPGNVLSILDKKLNFKKIYGLEISKSMIDIAQKKFPKAKYFVSRDLSKFKNNLDLVMFIDVLEHVPEPIKLLNQASKISEYQFVKIPLEDTVLRNLAKVFGLNKISSEGHINFWSKKNFLELLTKSGFKVIYLWTGNFPRRLHFYPRARKGKVNKIKKPFFWVYDNIGKALFKFPRLYSKLFSSNLYALIQKNSLQEP